MHGFFSKVQYTVMQEVAVIHSVNVELVNALCTALMVIAFKALFYHTGLYLSFTHAAIATDAQGHFDTWTVIGDSESLLPSTNINTRWH